MVDTLAEVDTHSAPDVQPVAAHRSTADLVRSASEQVSTLVRDELALARMEVVEKAKRAGIAGGLLGSAAAIAGYGVAALLAGIVLLLALALPAWAAALIVGGALMVLAGIIFLIGLRQMRRATPPVPREAVRGVRADIGAVAAAVEERGHR